MRQVVGRLTYAHVVSTLALFIALGGGAYAISLGKGDVTSRVIKNDTVRSPDVKANGLKGSDVKERTLKTAEFTAAASATGGSCSPASVLVPCAEVALTTPVAGKVLAIAHGLKDSNPATASGACQLVIDGTVFADADFGGAGAAGRDQLAISAVSQPVPAGAHRVVVQCVSSPTTGATSFRIDGVTAVLVGGG